MGHKQSTSRPMKNQEETHELKMTEIQPFDQDDEIFVGPVTQRELIITWRKRRALRLERERLAALSTPQESDISNDTECAQSLFDDAVTTTYEHGKLSLLQSPNQGNSLRIGNNTSDPENEVSDVFKLVAAENEPAVSVDSSNPVSIPDEGVIHDNKENDLVSNTSVEPSLTDDAKSDDYTLEAESEDSDLVYVQRPHFRFVLKPATLNVDTSSLKTEWVKRLDMNKIAKPKRPAYVQPVEH